MEEEKIIHPTVIVPDRLFLIGALYGFNAGRKAVEKNPQPFVRDHEVTNEDFYLGSWFEISCNKCGRHYTYDNPNDIPNKNLMCETDDCDNCIIFYGMGDVSKWRIGSIKFS